MHITMSEKVENAQTRIEAYGNENIDDSNYVVSVYVRSNDEDDFTESMSFSFPISCNTFDMMYSVLDAMADNLNVKNVSYNAYWSCRKLAISLYRMHHQKYARLAYGLEPVSVSCLWLTDWSENGFEEKAIWT